jgi:hypothetical protein
MSLVHPSYKLPQCQFNHKKIQKQLLEYMADKEADRHGLADLSEAICTKVVQNEVQRIKQAWDKQGSLPSVFIDTTSLMVSNGIKLIEQLDETGELEKMMKEIHDRIDRAENPEAYC